MRRWSSRTAQSPRIAASMSRRATGLMVPGSWWSYPSRHQWSRPRRCASHNGPDSSPVASVGARPGLLGSNTGGAAGPEPVRRRCTQGGLRCRDVAGAARPSSRTSATDTTNSQPMLHRRSASSLRFVAPLRNRIHRARAGHVTCASATPTVASSAGRKRPLPGPPPSPAPPAPQSTVEIRRRSPRNPAAGGVAAARSGYGCWRAEESSAPAVCTCN